MYVCMYVCMYGNLSGVYINVYCLLLIKVPNSAILDCQTNSLKGKDFMDPKTDETTGATVSLASSSLILLLVLVHFLPDLQKRLGDK